MRLAEVNMEMVLETAFRMFIVLFFLFVAYGPALGVGYQMPFYIRLMGKLSWFMLVPTYCFCMLWAGVWGALVFTSPDIPKHELLPAGFLHIELAGLLIAAVYALRRTFSQQYSWKVAL